MTPAKLESVVLWYVNREGGREDGWTWDISAILISLKGVIGKAGNPGAIGFPGPTVSVFLATVVMVT